jgi:hypothetical protein
VSEEKSREDSCEIREHINENKKANPKKNSTNKKTLFPTNPSLTCKINIGMMISDIREKIHSNNQELSL